MFSGKKPDCSKCPPNGYVIALPGNYDVLTVIDRYGHTLVDHDGSIKLQDIEYALSICDTVQSESNIYKVVVYLTTAINIRHKELKDGKENRARISSQRQGIKGRQESYFSNTKRS